MGKRKFSESAAATNVIQFSLAGLIIFSLALMGGASLAAYKLTAMMRPSLQADTEAVNPEDHSRSVHVGPWGELLTRDIELERPAEYLTEEVSSPHPEVWKFSGMKAAAVRALLAGKGLNAEQLDAVMKTAAETAAGTEVTPPLDFLLSLTAEARAKLCVGLAGLNAYLYFDYPFIFPDGNINSIYDDDDLNSDDVKLLRKLVYNNGTAQQLSDYDALLCAIPTVERRVALTRAMSRQSAVLARLVVKPDTDVEKLAQYWGHLPNVRFADTRPLLESLKQLPEGGSISLLYLLPKFARDRLYTFPLPPQPGDPTMDCHWTTFNFCNEVPDNRFNDPNYAVQYIRDNFYQIAAPSVCGDILLLMNDRNEIKHSAVYLADDIVFTKNGNNYRQPWMLMHIPDLLATYPTTPQMRAVYMRRKTD